MWIHGVDNKAGKTNDGWHHGNHPAVKKMGQSPLQTIHSMDADERLSVPRIPLEWNRG